MDFPEVFLENMTDAVLAVDREYRIAYANKTARQGICKDKDDDDYCYALFRGYEAPCAVPLTECPVRAALVTGDPILRHVTR